MGGLGSTVKPDLDSGHLFRARDCWDGTLRSAIDCFVSGMTELSCAKTVLVEARKNRRCGPPWYLGDYSRVTSKPEVILWLVQSYDAGDKESVESQKNRFTIIPKGQNTTAIDLDLDPFMQHGHVIELTGKTEVGARVMVNGREVPMIGPDGSFHYFMPALPPGESLVTITAQNAKGGVNTVQKKIVIQ